MSTLRDKIVKDIVRGIKYTEIARRHACTWSEVYELSRRLTDERKQQLLSKYDHMQLITDKSIINNWLKPR